MNTNQSQHIVTSKFIQRFNNDTKKVLSSIQKTKNNNDYDWTNQSYPHIIKFFDDKENFNGHDIIIGCHLIYGWMPTILDNFNVYNDNKLTTLLNNAKKHSDTGSVLAKDIESISKYINNSAVGASKVLHFINPDVYAIWDSRVCKYLHQYNKYLRQKFILSSSVSTRRYELYIQYLNLIKELSQDQIFKNNKNSFQNIMKYDDIDITNNRFAEYVMYFNGQFL